MSFKVAVTEMPKTNIECLFLHDATKPICSLGKHLCNNVDKCEYLEVVNQNSDIDTKYAWWKNTIFDIKADGIYYTILSTGEIAQHSHFDADGLRKRIEAGNASTVKEYMKERALQIELQNKIANFARVVNCGWEADWNDYNEPKYHCEYNHNHNLYEVYISYSLEYFNVIYFKSKELATECINKIIIPFMRKYNLDYKENVAK